MDLDFIAQWMLLAHAKMRPELLQRDTAAVLLAAGENALNEHYVWLNQLLFWLRLSASGSQVEAQNPRLQSMLAEGMGCSDFATLRKRLVYTQSQVQQAYHTIFALDN